MVEGLKKWSGGGGWVIDHNVIQTFWKKQNALVRRHYL
jgi:hypothetical protein